MFFLFVLFLLTAMSKLTEQMCWKLVKKERDAMNKISVAIYQKPSSNECYEQRSQNEPPLCEQSDDRNAAWYFFFYDFLIYSHLKLDICNA